MKVLLPPPPSPLLRYFEPLFISFVFAVYLGRQNKSANFNFKLKQKLNVNT